MERAGEFLKFSNRIRKAEIVSNPKKTVTPIFLTVSGCIKELEKPFNGVFLFEVIKCGWLWFPPEACPHLFVKGNDGQVHMTLLDGRGGFHVLDLAAGDTGNGDSGEIIFKKDDRGGAGLFAEIDVINGRMPAADQMPRRDRADFRDFVQAFDVHFLALHKFYDFRIVFKALGQLIAYVFARTGEPLMAEGIDPSGFIDQFLADRKG